MNKYSNNNSLVLYLFPIIFFLLRYNLKKADYTNLQLYNSIPFYCFLLFVFLINYLILIN